LSFRRFFIPAIIIIALIIAGVIICQFIPPKVPGDTPSIAVLPFEDFSQAKDQEVFCDGLKESIIHALKQARNLRVPATTPLFKDKERDYREIGEKLKVKTVLDGSVQKVEDNVRIMAKLIDITDESIIWTDQFDTEQQDIFTIQDTISMSIVDELKVNLLGGEETKIVKRYTEDTEAWRLYSQGRYYWNKRTEDGFNRAIDYFELAIKEDPSYALAHVGLADCYLLLGDYGYSEPKQAFPKAKNAALEALKLDDTLAEAYASLGNISTIYEWDWERAERNYTRAIELNPNYATAHHWYMAFLMGMGRYDEAIDKIKRAQELDPRSNIINTSVGWPYYFMRRYDDAMEAFQNALSIDEGFWYAHWSLGLSYSQKEMYDKALAEIQKAKELYNGWQPLIESSIGCTYARMGRREEARQVLNKLLERQEQDYVRPVVIAYVYFDLKENDRGFDWLNRAFEVRDPELTWLKVLPDYDPIRSDPRFTAILKKMGLDK
jgi:TolB-like protein/Tfp pilus assembly protein PilF